MKKTLAVAGATGFIGRWFIETYKHQYNIIALSRKKISTQNDIVEWRMVDLFSISSSVNALQGVDYALYLVHSMQPSTRLNQGNFEDTDLLLADNFSRAAETCKLKHIVYVGGILPKDDLNISKHLKSRFEVEQVLGSRSTPLTAVRAGIIIGPGGSSFRIVKRLVQNLPIMACPKWTKSKNQPVDLRIALKSIEQIFGDEKFFNLPIEIGGSEIVTYMDILKITAKEMKRKRWIFSIPFFSLGMSKLWVGLFSGSNKNFVSPLIESLRHDMTLKTSISLKNLPSFTLKETIKRASDSTITIPMAPKGVAQTKDKNTVRSVQRIANPARKTAEWVAQSYPIWLSKIFNKVIEAEEQNNLLKFKLLGLTLLQLEYIKNRSDKNRQLFYITGGYLTKRTNRGWLEFRSILDDNYIITAIHEFVPRLPWVIYKFTQAKAHLLVMKKFEKHLNTMKS
ncbi:MAG: epimerase [Crocinitomicaceae bacterium]|nr:epimerase [Crocinitomicaceae bacterium]